MEDRSFNDKYVLIDNELIVYPTDVEGYMF